MASISAATTLSLILFALNGTVVDLPARGRTSAEAIRSCERQVAQQEGIRPHGEGPGSIYTLIKPGANSFVYFFTDPTEPAHPAMIAITLHPMDDPSHPKEHEVEFHESYSGSEIEFLAWSKRVSYEFGRGFAAGIMGPVKKQSTD